MGIPSTGNRSDAQCYLLRILDKNYSDKIEFIYPDNCVFRIHHDFARNDVVKDFLKSEADILWFLDSDVVPPPDVLDIVVNHHEEWELAGAPYPLFMVPAGQEIQHIVFSVYKHKGESGGFSLANIPNKGTGFVGGVGTGCMFIKKEVFNKLSQPYFEFKYKDSTREIAVGEDLDFCAKVNDLGYRFFIDYSKVCKHYKNVCLRNVSDYAMMYAKKVMDGYIEELKKNLDVIIEQRVQSRLLEKNSKTAKNSKLILPPDLIR